MLTQDQKRAIFEEYKDRRNKVEDIAYKFGIARGEVTRVAVEMGAQPRLKTYGKKHGTTGNDKRICPKCKRGIDIKGAKFCCFCGSDMRTNKERLIERIEFAFADIQFMPQSARDNMQQLFIAIINELKG